MGLGVHSQLRRQESEQRGCSHAGTVSLIICHHDKPPEALVKTLPVAFLHSNEVCYDLTPGRSGAERFAPQNLEHLANGRVNGIGLQEDGDALTSPGLNRLECSTTYSGRAHQHGHTSDDLQGRSPFRVSDPRPIPTLEVVLSRYG